MLKRILSSELPLFEGSTVHLVGWVHRIRNLGGIRFVILRDRSGMSQIVVSRQVDLKELNCESVIQVEGQVKAEAQAPGGFEVQAVRVNVIAYAQVPPLEIFKPVSVSKHHLDTLLDHRAVSLRIPEVLDIFHIQNEILHAFQGYMRANGFIQITTPKLVLAGAEGGSAIFEVKYYDTKAFLAQSPQFYKQIMVGSGMERVFEIGHAYRAEKSETSRHITEFVSLDFEMGFIESEQDLIEMHAGLIKAIFAGVRENCSPNLARRNIVLPEIEKIPQISFLEAKQILAEKYGKHEGLEGDMDTEGEQLIGQWAREVHGSELVYVTGYEISKRPAYTMPVDNHSLFTRSFDLLYGGVEITTGGQRIHGYQQLVESFRQRGMNPESCKEYLEAFLYGMPPHGGMGMGLERLTKQMLNLANIKEACLFPRDRYRLTP
jgi:nondiscriminating aspartyl-tRNA synthetase